MLRGDVHVAPPSELRAQLPWPSHHQSKGLAYPIAPPLDGSWSVDQVAPSSSEPSSTSLGTWTDAPPPGAARPAPAIESIEVPYTYVTGLPPSNVRTVSGGYTRIVPPEAERPEGGAKLTTDAT